MLALRFERTRCTRNTTPPVGSFLSDRDDRGRILRFRIGRGTIPKPMSSWDWESRVCEFAPDSPLEESGFELLVPLVDVGLFGRNGKEITRVRERCSRIRQ
jgi:hypothetical protein